jgi:hypothetical protein
MPPGSGVVKRKAQASPSKQSIAAVVQRIQQIAAAHEGGVRQDVLEAEMSKTASQAEILVGLNQLMAKSIIVSGHRGGKLVFKVQSEEEAAKYGGLNAEDRLILQEVEKSGTGAIASKELKRLGGVPQQQLAKVLARLEQRRLIKSVKAVNAGNGGKKYMLYNLQPSKDITGGSWYNADPNPDPKP